MEWKTAQVKKKDMKQEGGSTAWAMPKKNSNMALEKSTGVTFGMVALSVEAVWLRIGK